MPRFAQIAKASDAVGQPAAPNPRRLAHALLVRCEATQAFADRLLNAALGKTALCTQDRSLVTELTYGTLRHQHMLDGRLNALLTKPVATLPAGVRAALRLGAYQLLMMRTPAYSAVNESVKLVGNKYGALMGVVNGVLRKLAKNEAKTAVNMGDGAAADEGAAAAAHPLWLQQHLIRALGPEEGRAYMVACMERPQVTVRVNTTRTTTAALQSILRGANIKAEISPYCADSLALPPAGQVQALPGFAEGLMAVQDGAATLVGHLLAPPPGAVVLDLCAAPGGKAMHAACLMGNEGHVIACDVHPGRLRLIERNAERLGHDIVTPLLADMATSEGATWVRQQLQDLPDVTHVMLDAPCSALGTLRRHPELRRKEQSSVLALTHLQRQLLDVAQTFVGPGGVLVYAVCTPTLEEGPEQVDAFLARYPDFALEAPPTRFAPVMQQGFVRTWPHRHQLDGFFAARLRRRATKLLRPQVFP